VTELGEGEGAIGVGEDALEGVGWRWSRRRRWRHGVHDLQRERAANAAQGEREPRLGRRGAMLDAEEQRVIDASEVEIGVSPGMEFGAAAQGLSGAERLRAFARVMDL
jgi:hypothetical protein